MCMRVCVSCQITDMKPLWGIAGAGSNTKAQVHRTAPRNSIPQTSRWVLGFFESVALHFAVCLVDFSQTCEVGVSHILSGSVRESTGTKSLPRGLFSHESVVSWRAKRLLAA